MEKHLNVMKKTVELAESCVETLEYIKSKLNQGSFEETVPLMNDLVIGFYQIEVSMQRYFDQLSVKRIEEKSNQLRSAMEHTVTAYEQRLSGKALEVIQFNLLPSCKRWKEEIEKALEQASARHKDSNGCILYSKLVLIKQRRY